MPTEYKSDPLCPPPKLVHAPWTEDQVASLTAYQQAGYVHPFTHGDGEDKVDLTATPDGWVAKAGGPVVQTWAHQFMCDWSWKNPMFEPKTPC